MPTDAQRMTSLEKKVKKLEKEAADLKKALSAVKQDIADMEDCCADVIKWIKQEVAWSNEVTGIMKTINWAKLKIDYPSGGGANPPQSPPTWPPL